MALTTVYTDLELPPGPRGIPQLPKPPGEWICFIPMGAGIPLGFGPIFFRGGGLDALQTVLVLSLVPLWSCWALEWGGENTGRRVFFFFSGPNPHFPRGCLLSTSATGQSSCTSRFLSPNLSEMCCKKNFPEDTATCRAFARSPFSPRSRASASGLQPSSNCGFEHPKASFWALPLSQDPPKPPPRCSMGCKELSCCSSPRPSEGGSLWVFFFASQLPSKPPCRMQGEGGQM